MRALLDPAGPGETLRDALGRIGPPEGAPFLLEGPGFDVRLAQGAAEIERIVVADGVRAGLPPRRHRGLRPRRHRVLRVAGGRRAAGDADQRGRGAVAPPAGAARLRPAPGGAAPARPPRLRPGRRADARDTTRRAPIARRRSASGRPGAGSRSTPASPAGSPAGGRICWSSEPGGRSSNPNLPLHAGRLEASRAGEVGLWAALEWSARWHAALRDRPRTGGSSSAADHGCRTWCSRPGESLPLPRVHVGAWGGRGATAEDGFNHLRRHVRDALAPDVMGQRPHPFVAYDHWFGIEQRLTEPLLRRQVDRAAELGLEYFVMDAGWYGGASENFANGVGNWERVDETKFPAGLEPLAGYVRSKGMHFGLWFEPERGRRGSDWVTQHPTWYWDIGNPVNLQLDLTQGEVQDGLIELVSAWIRRLDVRWLRLDFNQQPGPFWDRVDPTGKVQFAYVEGLYRVWDTLLARHPDLMIDNCASGGNRIDFGTLRRAGTMVISDHAEDPHVCRLMQTGGARVFPANYMNSSVYVGEHDGDACGPLELISRMGGSLTLCGHIAGWSAGHASRVRRLLDGYRAVRHVLMGDFYRLTTYPRSPDDWDVVQFLETERRGGGRPGRPRARRAGGAHRLPAAPRPRHHLPGARPVLGRRPGAGHRTRACPPRGSASRSTRRAPSSATWRRYADGPIGRRRGGRGSSPAIATGTPAHPGDHDRPAAGGRAGLRRPPAAAYAEPGPSRGPGHTLRERLHRRPAVHAGARLPARRPVSPQPRDVEQSGHPVQRAATRRRDPVRAPAPGRIRHRPHRQGPLLLLAPRPSPRGARGLRARPGFRSRPRDDRPPLRPHHRLPAHRSLGGGRPL